MITLNSRCPKFHAIWGQTPPVFQGAARSRLSLRVWKMLTGPAEKRCFVERPRCVCGELDNSPFKQQQKLSVAPHKWQQRREWPLVQHLSPHTDSSTHNNKLLVPSRQPIVSSHARERLGSTPERCDLSPARAVRRPEASGSETLCLARGKSLWASDAASTSTAPTTYRNTLCCTSEWQLYVTSRNL